MRILVVASDARLLQSVADAGALLGHPVEPSSDLRSAPTGPFELVYLQQGAEMTAGDVAEQLTLAEQVLTQPHQQWASYAAGLAREMNNPLSSLMGGLSFALELLGRKELHDHAQLRECLVGAMEGAERVRRTVRDLLASEGAERGKSSLGEAPPRLRLLVIDDELYLRKTLELMLSPEHDVECCGGGREALERLASGSTYDLILCDLMMPAMTGVEFYEALAQTQPHVLARIVFMTGGAFTREASSFLQRVPNRVLEKPFTQEVLAKVVAAVR